MSSPFALDSTVRARLRRGLLAWYRRSRRDLPWRRTRDPYAIWISETMLQQTRVGAVVPYYERFLAEFPDVAALARAPEERVLALWSGLGYYTRARNLHRAARLSVMRHGSQLPSDPVALAALPGIGRYTLGAVLSIAFDQPRPVVDGNVVRVLSRVFALRVDARSSAGRERFWELAEALVPKHAAGDFNQALMELGATVCLPRAPRCDECPVRGDCRALAIGRPEAFPAPRARTKTRRVLAVAVLLESSRGIWLERRAAGANRGLLDVPTAEANGAGESVATLKRRLSRRLGVSVRGWKAVGSIRHGILDRAYEVTLFRAGATDLSPGVAGRWIHPDRRHDAPLTARARKALQAGV